MPTPVTDVMNLLGVMSLGVVGEVNDVYPSWEAAWRILAGAGLGAVIGIEREVNDQPAGLRTHITVALGAAVFGVISTLGFSEFVTDQRDVNIQFDVTRVASQVVVGIGFIGAGMIFRTGSKIRNLTTAASLWVVAAVGLAAGVGDIGIACVAAAALLVALFLLRLPRDLLRNRITRTTLRASVGLAGVDDADAVLEAVRSIDGIELKRVAWGKLDDQVILDLSLEGDPATDPASLLGPIVARPDVLSLRTEALLTSELTDED